MLETKIIISFLPISALHVWINGSKV